MHEGQEEYTQKYCLVRLSYDRFYRIRIEISLKLIGFHNT